MTERLSYPLEIQKACSSLYKILKEKGVESSIGISKSAQRWFLTVYVSRGTKLKLIPESIDGFQTVVRHSSKIVPATA